jgi:hypothetical protein
MTATIIAEARPAIIHPKKVALVFSAFVVLPRGIQSGHPRPACPCSYSESTQGESAVRREYGESLTKGCNGSYQRPGIRALRVVG